MLILKAGKFVYNWTMMKPRMFFNFEDIFASIIFFYIFSIGLTAFYMFNSFKIQIEYLELFKHIIKYFLWIYYYALIHVIGHQSSTMSIQEDMINKPYRPIPSGRISQLETRILFIIHII